LPGLIAATNPSLPQPTLQQSIIAAAIAVNRFPEPLLQPIECSDRCNGGDTDKRALLCRLVVIIIIIMSFLLLLSVFSRKR
jgi:hypothetical protein